MQRRDVLKLLSSTAAISAFPLEALALLESATHQAGHSRRRAMDEQQDATVTAIAELIIPETDTPGAKGAKVNDFIDLLLAEWYEPAETRQFLDGVNGVDVESRKLFAKNFAECTPAQQAQLMTRWDAEAMEFAITQRTVVSPSQTMPANFFYLLKKLTLTGYYTSEIGFQKELGRTIIPISHAGCAPLVKVKVTR